MTLALVYAYIETITLLKNSSLNYILYFIKNSCISDVIRVPFVTIVKLGLFTVDKNR